MSNYRNHLNNNHSDRCLFMKPNLQMFSNSFVQCSNPIQQIHMISALPQTRKDCSQMHQSFNKSTTLHSSRCNVLENHFRFVIENTSERKNHDEHLDDQYVLIESCRRMIANSSTIWKWYEGTHSTDKQKTQQNGVRGQEGLHAQAIAVTIQKQTIIVFGKNSSREKCLWLTHHQTDLVNEKVY